MRSHALKTLPPYFEAVADGRKTFEVRKDDRGFAVGDMLVLREWDADAQQYTGRLAVRRVTYVLAGYAAIAQGYVVLGLASIPHRTDLAAALERDAAYERERGNHPQAAEWEQLARDLRAEDQQ